MIFDEVLEDYVNGKLPSDEFLKWIEVKLLVIVVIHNLSEIHIFRICTRNMILQAPPI